MKKTNDVTNWQYYNHAMVPKTAHDHNPDLLPIENGSVWKNCRGIPLLARWTTEFDCGYETNWWYVIKDTVFDISELKAKRRYEINKGNKNFRVVKINPLDFKEDLYNVQIAAYSAYPQKYRPTVDKKTFLVDVDKWCERFAVFACFHRDTGEMSGYALLSHDYPNYLGFRALKTKPEYERLAVNAALVAEILRYYNDFLSSGGYICDGARSIYHETSFQDYLEKYFGFRKAYCHLHIVYNPKIKWLIKLCYSVRRVFFLLDSIKMVHQLNSVLRMEEICRKDVSRL